MGYLNINYSLQLGRQTTSLLLASYVVCAGYIYLLENTAIRYIWITGNTPSDFTNERIVGSMCVILILVRCMFIVTEDLSGVSTHNPKQL